MARYTLSLLVALVAQQVAAVPIVFPSSLLPSLTLTSIPLPTGAKLDHAYVHPRDAELALPLLTSIDLSSLSITLPSITVPTTLTGLPSLSISIPTSIVLPSLSTTLDKRTLSVPIAAATGLPTGLPLPPLPTGFPSGPIPTGPLPTGAPKYPGGLLQPDN